MSNRNQEIGSMNVQKNKKVLANWKISDYFWGYIMIAPLMIGLFIFNVLPIFETVYYSFTRYKGFAPPKWIGFLNFIELFKDPNLWMSITNTLLFVVLAIPASMFISVILAVLLNNKIRGVKVFRTLYFLPQVTLPAAIAMGWMWLFNSDYGLINQFLSIFNIPKIAWISSPQYALLSLAIVSIWGTIGYNMIILLSGLKNIPRVYYEACEIDGAGPLRQFTKITLPLLSPTLFFLLVTSLINAMEVFDLIWLMIGKTSPVIDNVRSMVYTYYESAFIKYDKGYAAAIAIVLFAIIMVITVIQLVLQKKWVHYDD